MADIVDNIKSLIASGDLSEDERATGYFSLGKRFDSNLIPYFRDRLAIEMEDSPVAVYQLLIALDNLEEPVFGADRNGSYSYADVALNVRDAKRYLLNLT